jgi:hypothetical protein
VTSSANSFADALRNPIQFLGGGAINKGVVDGIAKPALEDAYIAARGAIRAALATLDFFGVDTTPVAAGLNALQAGVHIASGKATTSMSDAQAKAGGGVGSPDSLPSLARKQLKQLEIISMNTANFRSDMDATLLDLHDLRTRRGGGSVVQSESFGGTNVMERMARANAHAARRLNERQLTYAAL